MGLVSATRLRVLLLAALAVIALLALAVGLRPADPAEPRAGTAAAPGGTGTSAATHDATATASAPPGTSRPSEAPGDGGDRKNTAAPSGHAAPAAGPTAGPVRGGAAHAAPEGKGSEAAEPAGGERGDGELAGVVNRPTEPREPSADGLVRAAAEEPAEQVPGQARRGPAPDRMSGPARAAVDPEQVHGKDGQAPGGCVAEYGKDGQCLPLIPPSMARHAAEMERAGVDPASMDHHWSCKELRGFFPDGIAVRVAGKDPQELDRNGDGLACGPGD